MTAASLPASTARRWAAHLAIWAVQKPDRLSRRDLAAEDGCRRRGRPCRCCCHPSWRWRGRCSAQVGPLRTIGGAAPITITATVRTTARHRCTTEGESFTKGRDSPDLLGVPSGEVGARPHDLIKRGPDQRALLGRVRCAIGRRHRLCGTHRPSLAVAPEPRPPPRLVRPGGSRFPCHAD